MSPKKTAVIYAALLPLGASLLAAEGQVAAKCDIAAAMVEAQAAQKMAQSIGGEWRDIDRLMKQAGDAAAEGDCTKAAARFAMAKFQGEMGYQQALSQSYMGNPDYLTRQPAKPR